MSNILFYLCIDSGFKKSNYGNLMNIYIYIYIYIYMYICIYRMHKNKKPVAKSQIMAIGASNHQTF